MKKLILLFITMTLCFGMFCTTALGATTYYGEKVTYTDTKITIDGKPVKFTDAKPIFQPNYNRTLVPARVVSEAMGCNIQLTTEGGGYVVCLSKYTDNHYISCKIGYDSWLDIWVDNNFYKDLKIYPCFDFLNGRTYLPARYIAETFGYSVDWNSKTNTIAIKKVSNLPIIQDIYN